VSWAKSEDEYSSLESFGEQMTQLFQWLTQSRSYYSGQFYSPPFAPPVFFSPQSASGSGAHTEHPGRCGAGVERVGTAKLQPRQAGSVS